MIAKASKRLTKSYLGKYLKECTEICSECQKFDIIGWWKSNQLKYYILSRIVVDILSIPMSIITVESTFSEGERVVDTYRSKLGVKTI